MTRKYAQYLVPFDGSFSLKSAATQFEADISRNSADKCTGELHQTVTDIGRLQKKLYAQAQNSILLVFQGLDAAGKDGAIRALLTGLNPAGCSVHSFKVPSHLEASHDFLWRCSKALPAKGKIGIFNRSHYEDVLVPSVHPEILPNVPHQKKSPKRILSERCESIVDFERHLVRNGTTILKFWLNISKTEQKRRLLKRLDSPEHNWKFDKNDLAERPYIEKYRKAYGKILAITSHRHAPWYTIPADSKPHARLLMAQILFDTMKALKPEFPKTPASEKASFDQYRKTLMSLS